MKKLYLYIVIQLFLFNCLLGYGQMLNENHMLIPAVDSNTAIRFFLNGDDQNYYHAPFIFQLVDPGDKRINTAGWGKGGWVVYISSKDMTSVMTEMSAIKLSWAESKQVENFTNPLLIPFQRDMIITVVNSRGTAKSNIKQINMCKTLGSIDVALQKPRLLWEFQTFRSQYYCDIPNFNRKKYPVSMFGRTR